MNSWAILAFWLAVSVVCFASGKEMFHDDLLVNDVLKNHKDQGSSNAEGASRNKLFRRLVASSKDYNVEDSDVEDAGEPLFLTPLLNSGQIKEARNLSRVNLPNDPNSTVSYSGYLTLDDYRNSNMFFWFFPAKNNPYDAPVAIWLQGGPGGSSLFGLFAENGPFNVNADMSLVYRQYSWTDHLNVLYFDNPVGTGFSFTTDGYCQDEVCVGNGLYSATQQFLTLFPELRPNPLFVTGESYAGKYVPALSYTIHKKNPSDPAQRINFKGMAIGDGLCDPVSMVDYGGALYGVGLLDQHGRDQFRERQDKIVQDIEQEKWKEAFLGFDRLLNGDTISVPSFFTNLTGLTYYYNYGMDKQPESMDFYAQYVNMASVRRAIHVGNMTFNNGVAVEKNLELDVMQSVKPWIEELLNNREYRVMIYNGQLDIIIAYPLTRNFLSTLEWNDADLYHNATRHIWRVGGAVAGYVKETPNFVEVMVRDAGHMVPYDQPERAYNMINRFTQAV